MPPQQQYQPSPQPQRPLGPPSEGNPMPQQHQSGHYAVVPPLVPMQNDGHSGHNPYDFIMNPNSGRAKGAGFMGDGFLKRIILLVAGVALVFIIIGVVITKLTPKGNAAGMISIAQRQQEIVRIATEATQKTSSQDATNFVTTVELSITSSQKQLITYLGANGTTISTKVLALDQDSQTDVQLTNAASANNYDSAVTTNLTEQLQDYKSLLQATYKETTGKNGKALLQTDYAGASLLITKAKAITAELQ